jgi:hypothetical protein
MMDGVEIRHFDGYCRGKDPELVGRLREIVDPESLTVGGKLFDDKDELQTGSQQSGLRGWELCAEDGNADRNCFYVRPVVGANFATSGLDISRAVSETHGKLQRAFKGKGFQVSAHDLNTIKVCL